MREERKRLIDHQVRAYHEGIIENINNDWIFFLGEWEEAIPLEQFFLKEIQIFHQNKWTKGILTEDFMIEGKRLRIKLEKQTIAKIRKTLPYSLQTLLNELDDDSYFQFIEVLNQLDFSLFDVLYCYNHLSFQTSEKKKGVNFLIFDNTIDLCSVHHHFDYDARYKNRFHFTLSTGKQASVQIIKPDLKNENCPD